MQLQATWHESISTLGGYIETPMRPLCNEFRLCLCLCLPSCKGWFEQRFRQLARSRTGVERMFEPSFPSASSQVGVAKQSSCAFSRRQVFQIGFVCCGCFHLRMWMRPVRCNWCLWKVGVAAFNYWFGWKWLGSWHVGRAVLLGWRWVEVTAPWQLRGGAGPRPLNSL